MTVDYQMIQTRPLAPDQVLGYAHADFAYPGRPTVSVFIGVVIKHDRTAGASSTIRRPGSTDRCPARLSLR